MKRLFFSLFILLTWYMAAMYRIPSLMALSLAQLFLVCFLFFSTGHFRKNFQSGICEAGKAVRNGEKISVEIWVKNQSPLPLGRYRLKFTSSYEPFQKVKFFTYEGSVDGKTKEREQVVLEAKWCGRISLSLTQTCVFDYLGLFKRQKKENLHERISVLPATCPMQVIFSEQGFPAVTGEEPVYEKGNSSGEIRQLKEYMPGDLVRQIHWKQSARMDRLLVKEFQKETEEGAVLYLDLSWETMPGLEELDAFYQILSGLLLGILQKRAWIRVKWKGTKERDYRRQISSGEEAMSLLLILYEQMEELFTEGSAKGRIQRTEGLLLNLDREIYYRKKLIHRFQLDSWEREIKEIRLFLP